jgi:hypothetical protein
MTSIRQRWPELLAVVVVLAVFAMPVLAASISTPTSGTVPLTSNSDTTVAVVGSSSTSQDIQVSVNQFPNDDTVNVITDSGNLTASSTADVNLTVDKTQITGPYTNLTNIDASGDTVTVNPEDKAQFSFGGDLNRLNVSGTIALDDGQPDFVYNGSSGTTDVTVRGLPANTLVSATDQTGTKLGSATTDANGVLELTGLTNSKHIVSLSNPDGPTLSNLAPDGQLQQKRPQLSVQVNDTDFPAGDTVTVDFAVDGTSEGTTTVTSNGTTSVTLGSNLVGGSHTLSVTATDSAGLSTTRSTTFLVPDQLQLKNVSAPETNITGVSATITAIGDDEVTQTTTNGQGELNMTGFPVYQPLIIDIENTSNYYERTTILDSIYQQQNIYLLNNTIPSQEVRFEVNDRSGNFPPEDSFVGVERALNISGETRFVRVSGGGSGVVGHTATLEDGQRYRIAVKNEDLDQRELGGYSADASETVGLEVGSSLIQVDNRSSYRVTGSLENSTNTVKFNLRDPSDSTSRIDVKIYERGNESNVELDKEFTGGPYGNLTVTEPVNATADSWVIEYELDRDGETQTGTIITGNRQPIEPGISNFWQSLIGVSMLIVVAGLFGGVRSRIGAIVVPLFAAMLFFIGWLPAAVGAGAIIVALLLGVIWMTSSNRGVPG